MKARNFPRYFLEQTPDSSTDQGPGSFADLVLCTSISACLSGRHLESESNDGGGETVCLRWTKQDQIPPIFAIPSAAPRDVEVPFGSWPIFMLPLCLRSASEPASGGAHL